MKTKLRVVSVCVMISLMGVFSSCQNTDDPNNEINAFNMGQKTIYANSGTWIDHNTLSSTKMEFVVITPQSDEASSLTLVKLYSYDNEKDTEIAADSIKL